MSAAPGPPAGEGLLGGLLREDRERLMALAFAVTLPGGTRVFEEGGEADRFWIVRSGAVALDLHVPGRGRTVVETIGAGGLLGWSWLCPPHRWHLGAEARGTTVAWEFDAAAVRELCAERPLLGLTVVTSVAGTIGERLRAARIRLLDLYGPPWDGPVP